LSKIGLIISMIGGILFFILTYIFARHFYVMWKLDNGFLLFFLFILFINGGAIVGGLLGFIDIIWQIGKNWKWRLVNGGRILCFLAGISFPLYLLYNFLPNPSTFFIGFFESLIENFYISLPELIILIGGITSILEWGLERRKSKSAQE